MTVWVEADGLRRVVTTSAFPGADEGEPRPPVRRAAASDEAVLDLVRSWLGSVGEDPPPELRVVENANGSGPPRAVKGARGRRPHRRRW